MRKILLTGTFCLAVLIFIGCGKSTEDELFYSISGKVNLTDKEYWADEQEVRFGIFNQGENQPEWSVQLKNPVNGSLNYSLANIPEGEYIFKIYASKNTINKADLLTYGNQKLSTNLVLADKNMTLVFYSRVQEQVFSSCLQCHGGSSGAIASGLNLLPANSYNNLVNTTSENADLVRVKPFLADSSFILNVLYENNISFDHPASSTASQKDKKLVENWIIKGALND